MRVDNEFLETIEKLEKNYLPRFSMVATFPFWN
jgi:hypothetical protein